ncbi:hypothetical protein DXT76_04110 [Halobacillus trueperi]|uniref:Uncharacterized protein n=1 Tax=Halobacillus trueperi TaxID=156205 RepID=A0A3D8VRK5_9BACI|nr:hypothetical protein [Halobacillus trueperi]RDY72036.1 hypothetical protein DXT76_04110 [Halobacillus trueperi]
MRQMLITLCCLLFPFFYLSTTVTATSWAYPFVVYDGFIYVVEEETVEVQVEEKIGEVTAYSDMHQYEGNFSNVFEKGTAYYKIVDHPATQVIAVEEREGVFRRAEREAGADSFLEKGKPVERNDLVIGTLLFVCFIIFIGGAVYLFQRSGT